jgi:Transposase DDE domain group 1
LGSRRGGRGWSAWSSGPICVASTSSRACRSRSWPGGPQGELLPTWQLYPFVTNRTDPLALVEAEHRQHAVVELHIRDLEDQALAHFPSGRFFANAAWTVIAALAHNLLRWTGVLGLPGRTIRAARTLRRRLLAIPGRLTRSARRWTLHLLARWPWQHAFIEALTRIRALPAAR